MLSQPQNSPRAITSRKTAPHAVFVSSDRAPQITFDSISVAFDFNFVEFDSNLAESNVIFSKQAKLFLPCCIQRLNKRSYRFFIA